MKLSYPSNAHADASKLPLGLSFTCLPKKHNLLWFCEPLGQSTLETKLMGLSAGIEHDKEHVTTWYSHALKVNHFDFLKILQLTLPPRPSQ